MCVGKCCVDSKANNILTLNFDWLICCLKNGSVCDDLLFGRHSRSFKVATTTRTRVDKEGEPILVSHFHAILLEVHAGDGRK